jgi:glycosyltransferase A (GT-A) superfamily protein (DUF2064 family)
MSTLVVIAKECLPGRVKTRLSPALSPEAAAEVAAASLAATLDAAARVPADRHLLFLAGRPPAGCDFEVLHQPDGTLDRRLAALFDAVDDRTLLIGMDTPQVDPGVLTGVLEDASGADAWFGGATDGGFWALGLDAPTGALLTGVPMSTPWTGAVQRARLVAAGLRIRDLPQLTDVDTIATAQEVAALVPGTRFADLIAERDAA